MISAEGQAIPRSRHIVLKISRHLPVKVTVVRRRGARRCRGNGRFPYTAMTGGPAKIIASANGCTLPPAPASAPDNGHRWHTCRTAGCERPFADEGGGRLP